MQADTVTDGLSVTVTGLVESTGEQPELLHATTQ